MELLGGVFARTSAKGSVGSRCGGFGGGAGFAAFGTEARGHPFA